MTSPSTILDKVPDEQEGHKAEYVKAYVVPGIHGVSRLETIPLEQMTHFSEQNNCPACGCLPDWLDLISLGGTTASNGNRLACCRQCSHVTYRKMPSQQWIEEFYSRNWDEYGRVIDPTGQKDYSPKPPATHLGHLLALNLPKNARILDYGCGFGKDLKNLAALGYQNLYGVEASAHRAELALQYFPGRVEHGTTAAAARLAEKSGGFDLIISRHVFEHLADPFRTLVELKKLLMPGGKVILLTPDVYTESPIGTALFMPHLHLFNKTSMMKMMRRAGLKSFVWSAAKTELVVAGSNMVDWEATADYSDREESITQDYLRRLSDFITRPWRKENVKNRSYFWYFGPYKYVQYADGFTPVTGLASYLAYGVSLAAIYIPQSQSIRGSYRLFKVMRLLCKKESIIHSTFLGFQKIGDSSIPWLTMPKGGIPVLVK